MIYHFFSIGTTLPPGPHRYVQGLPGEPDPHPSPIAVETKFRIVTVSYTHYNYERNVDLKTLTT
jgi:hypothetical protein